jgi:alkanesulfonate monooxygenase SsuD/methylene tetrahydromethanopterin reductase-like flavin-dependent oxidoreductase (luciferase family)
MAALTLDHLCASRHILGLGVSGPQVVEGWYGQPFAKPLARTREYVDILRQVWRREAPVTSDGLHYPLPLNGGGTTPISSSQPRRWRRHRSMSRRRRCHAETRPVSAAFA